MEFQQTHAKDLKEDYQKLNVETDDKLTNVELIPHSFGWGNL